MSTDHAGGREAERPLHQRIASAPVVHDGARAAATLAGLAERCRAEPALAELDRLITVTAVRDLLAGIFGASPYLTLLIEGNPAAVQRARVVPAEQRFAALLASLAAAAETAQSVPDIMRALRLFKADVALLTARCDLGGAWPVMVATRRLSEAADAAVA